MVLAAGATLHVPNGSIVNYRIIGDGNIISYNAVFNKEINITGDFSCGGNVTLNGNITARNLNIGGVQPF